MEKTTNVLHNLVKDNTNILNFLECYKNKNICIIQSIDSDETELKNITIKNKNKNPVIFKKINYNNKKSLYGYVRYVINVKKVDFIIFDSENLSEEYFIFIKSKYLKNIETSEVEVIERIIYTSNKKIIWIPNFNILIKKNNFFKRIFKRRKFYFKFESNQVNLILH
jgi:hypothetical protein